MFVEVIIKDDKEFAFITEDGQLVNVYLNGKWAGEVWICDKFNESELQVFCCQYVESESEMPF